jgi:hypothetical protein
MEYPLGFPVLKENLAALDRLPFFDVHPGLHARKIVGDHGDAGCPDLLADHLDGPARNGEV